MKNGSEGKDIFGDSRKRCRAVGRDHAKNRTALRTDNIVGFVTVPTEKKNKLFYRGEKLIYRTTYNAADSSCTYHNTEKPVL